MWKEAETEGLGGLQQATHFNQKIYILSAYCTLSIVWESEEKPSAKVN